MFRNTALAASLAALFAVPATAQSLDDFTGFYAGAQLGYAGVDTDVGLDGSDWMGGIILGYDYDFGDWVAGVSFDYDWTDVDVGGAATLKSVWRLKARGGYNWDNNLVYVAAGYTDSNTEGLGSDDGWVAGIGYEYRIQSDLSLGAELLYHQFDNYNGSGVDVDATTLQFRAAYRF